MISKLGFYNKKSSEACRISCLVIFFIALFLFAFPATTIAEETGPEQIILTWSLDPATSQTITWLTPDCYANKLQLIDAAGFEGDFTASIQVEATGGQFAASSNYRYSVTLSNLNPDTQYIYRVGRDEAWSEALSFTTAADTADFSFLYLGDVQEGYVEWGSLLEQVYNENPQIRFALLGGDLTNDDSDYVEWGEFLDAATGVFSRVPVMPAKGNHDGELFNEFFVLPVNGPRGVSGNFYSFDYGEAHFVVLDSSNIITDSVKQWLQQDLQNTDKKWKFAVFHHPPYQNFDDNKTIDDALREHWVPILEQNQVDMVFVGHQHVYMRTHPIYEGEVTNDSYGIVYVMGNSGSKHYELGQGFPYIAREETGSNYQIIEIEGGVLNLIAKKNDGELIETFTLNKDEKPGGGQIPIDLLLSKTIASLGESVTATGKASPNAWVPIKLVDEAGNIVLFDTGKADAEGNYSIDFIIPDTVSGILTVIVGEGSIIASQDITVVAEEISLSLSKTTAIAGENVTATGKTSPNAWVPIKVVDEGGNIILFDSGKADEEGNYSINFIIPENVVGILTVVVGEGSNVASQIITVVTEEPIDVTSVYIVEDDQTLEVGQTFQFNAVVEPADATNKNVIWSSSNETVAIVDNNGLVTAVAEGNAVITVTTEDGKFTDTVNITVGTKPIKKVEKPKAFPNGGAVVSGTQITLKTTTKGAEIFYTVDGSIPTKNSTLYKEDEPITIDNPITLKAIAIKKGMDDSDILTVEFTIATPIENDDEVTVDEENKELAITEDTIKKLGSVKINIPDNIKDAKLSVSALLKTDESGRVITEPLPELNIATTDTSLSSKPIELSIPKGATITAPEDWNGTINVPTVEPVDSVKVQPDPGKKVTVNSVIEVGYGDTELIFDKALRLVIPDQAGKDAGYYREGKFYKIPSLPSYAKDNQDWADVNIAPGKDGKMDVGSDLVIWTKHFTKFISYTQTDVSPEGGGGGITPKPVTSTTGKAIVTPSAGGSISLGNEATIEIPAYALTGTSAKEVKVSKVTAPPGAPVGFKLISNVYEFSVGGENSYKFAKEVTITLSFDPSVLKAGETPAIYYYNQSEKKWVHLGGKVTGNTVSVQVDHFTQFAVMSVEALPVIGLNLTDINGHWAEYNIKKLVALGAVSGYPDGTFKPDNNITRSEFVTILVKAFNRELESGGKVFADTVGHWAAESIAIAASHGIVKGYDENTFGPDDTITREQMVVMIANAANLIPAEVELPFIDSSSISAWAREAMAAAVNNGIIGGYPDNTVRPQGEATRCEAATVIVNAL
jgi:uncharacterized protein YjdB